MSSYIWFNALAYLPKEAKSLLIGLSIAITEVEIQQKRIAESKEKLEIAHNQRRENDPGTYERFMADLHFYLIAWGSINKILYQLRKILNDPKLDRIHTRRRTWFKNLRLARNSLEHIDERILNAESAIAPLDQIYVTRSGNFVKVFGTRIEISESSFRRIEILRTELNKWHSNIPTILDRLREKYGKD